MLNIPISKNPFQNFINHVNSIFEMNARLDYKFVINGTTWILDPENPKQVSGGFGPNSELAMPAYIQPWEIKYNSDIKALLRLTVVWNIPVACNRATADFIISSPLISSEYERTMPIYEDYKKRR